MRLSIQKKLQSVPKELHPALKKTIHILASVETVNRRKTRVDKIKPAKEVKVKEPIDLEAIESLKAERRKANIASGIVKAGVVQIPCYLYTGKLKEFPEIQITQIRFKAFINLELCKQWCLEHCFDYIIKSDKTDRELYRSY